MSSFVSDFTGNAFASGQLRATLDMIPPAKYDTSKPSFCRIELQGKDRNTLVLLLVLYITLNQSIFNVPQEAII